MPDTAALTIPTDNNGQVQTALPPGPTHTTTTTIAVI